MARIRTVKPDFWRHEQLSELPEATHMLAAALLNYADDEGYFNANPKLVQAECCPLREPSVSIQDSLTALARIGYIVLGKGADGRTYGAIVKFTAHQRVNRPVKSKIKGLDIAWDGSPPTHAQLTEDSLTEEEMEEEREGREIARPHAIPDDFLPREPDYNRADFARFVATCRAKGKKRVDWQAEWEVWKSRRADYGEPTAPKAQGPPPPPQTHVRRDDPRWTSLEARYREERGKRPPVDSNDGWFYPNDWLAH